MKFSDLAWGAVCYFYTTKGDSAYIKLFSNAPFISKLRHNPQSVSYEDFQEQVISGFLNKWAMMISERTGRDILSALVELQPYISSLRGTDLVTCDLSDKRLIDSITHIYDRLFAVDRVWVTGASKVAHILNDSLFAMLDWSILAYFNLSGNASGLVNWLKVVQQSAKEITEDFRQQGWSGSPEWFLSEKLGYATHGCIKSLAKFLDEFYWLTAGNGLPVPPKWVPEL